MGSLLFAAKLSSVYAMKTVNRAAQSTINGNREELTADHGQNKRGLYRTYPINSILCVES